MKFAKVVFVGAGVWGIVLITAMYFLFDEIGRQHASPITYPQFYYGFLAVTLAWQFAFLVIGSDPTRFRLMMIPSVIEKLAFVQSMSVLFIQDRIAVTDMMVVVPDFLFGVLFVIAFMETPASPDLSDRQSHTVALPVKGSAADPSRSGWPAVQEIRH
jgi:hypothetical protein